MNFIKNNEAYFKPKQLYGEHIAVYSRVSTATQDMKNQIGLAEAYINNHAISKGNVIWIEDDGVSAIKIGLDDRPGLQELRTLIKQGKVKTIIVYSRDRLARNFYQYVSLIKEFYTYNINVIFTASNQPKFSKKLAVEALYGIFSQEEGMNISSRKTDTQKQFPSSIFGFIKHGKRFNVKYTLNPNLKNELKAFFNEIMIISHEEEFFLILTKYKRLFKKSYIDLIRYLNNPFYSGNMKTLYNFEKLNHVEPLITLDDFLKIQNVVQEMEIATKNAIILSSNNAFIHPLCSECKKQMTYRTEQLGKSGYFICKKKHKEIKINAEEYNIVISKQTKKIVKALNTQTMKDDIFSHLNKLEKKLNQQINKLSEEVDSIHEEITLNYSLPNSNKTKALVTTVKNIKNDMEQIHLNLIKIDEARLGIKDYIDLIKTGLANNLEEYDLYFLTKLFYTKIEVSNQSLIYHTTLTKYFNDGDVIV